MKKLIPFVVLVLLTGCSTLSYTIDDQDSHTSKITRVRDGYVLIGTDQGLGSLNERVTIQRLTAQGVMDVGTVELIRFSGGRAAARVVSEKDGLHIQAGDFVKRLASLDKLTDDDGIDKPSAREKAFRNTMGRFALMFAAGIVAAVWLIGNADAP